MMNQRHLFAAATMCVIFSPLFAAVLQSQSPAKQPADGERIFAQNCARCHNAPESLSPRVTGTVVRHMRVRASLSRHDEEQLLRFLNP